MNEVATAPVPSPPKVQRWGLGDALVGWVVIYLSASVWGVAVIAATGHAGDEFDDLQLGVVALAQLGLAAGFFVVPWLATKYKGNGIVADLGVRARWSDLWTGGLAGIVTQIVLLKLATKLRDFAYDPSRSFRAWLKTVAQHAWLDFLNA